MPSRAKTENGRDVPEPPQELGEALRALRASEERELLLRNELAHRVRNIFAITRSIFSRTVEASDTLEYAANHFLGRLDALARYHGRSASFPRSGFDLEDMVYAELLVYAVLDDPRVEVSGPPVSLGYRTGEIIGLALHELTTNAIKFGALAGEAERGQLRIGWTRADGTIALDWTESGIAIITPAPIRDGFGRVFIERVLPYQLGGESSFIMKPGGLACRIVFSLSNEEDTVDPSG